MAQPSTAQREPSMEEILASIRRIIEDSENGSKNDTALDVSKADNDDTASVRELRRKAESGGIVDVETFRTELRAPAQSALSAAVYPSDFQEMDESVNAVNEDKPGLGAPLSFSSPAKPASSTRAMPSMDDWRLGTVESVPKAAPPAVDDLSSVDAMLEDAIAADELALRPNEDSGQPHHGHLASNNGSEQDLAPARTAIISDHTGRQVAAAFGELAEAFAARSHKSIETMAEDLLRPMLQDWLDNNLPHLVERLVREEIERVARGG